jgi:hypothetical protein
VEKKANQKRRNQRRRNQRNLRNNMLKVDNKTINKRWDEAPDVLREAVFSPVCNDALENVCEEFHLVEEKRVILRRLGFFVFFGFIHLQDLYKEIKDSLGIDGRLALEIYQELDKKVFSPFHKEIEDNYLKFKIGVVRPEDIDEAPKAQIQRVVLKEQEPSVVDLKPVEIIKDRGERTENSEERVGTQETEPPSPLEEKEKPPVVIKPTQEINEQGKEEREKGKVEERIIVKKPIESIPLTPKPLPLTLSDVADLGPVIIHKREEPSSVSQTKATSGFKINTFGGFFGSFKSSIPRQQDAVSKAQVQTPSNFKKEEMSEAGKVPVVVKKYEEQPKTIHYSGFKTDLGKKSEEKDNSEKIDLNKL